MLLAYEILIIMYVSDKRIDRGPLKIDNITFLFTSINEQKNILDL